MKRKIILSLLACFFTFHIFAQPRHNQHDTNPRHGDRQIAVTEDGVRIILFPNGTWKIAPRQPELPRYTSEIKGVYLFIYENGLEVDRLRVYKSFNYDMDSRCYKGSVSFGAATYLFDGKENTISYLGKELIGKAGRFDDAVYSAAFDFTENIYNGIKAEMKGVYLFVYDRGKEIEKLRVRHDTWYDMPSRSYKGSVSIGNATYQFDSNDQTVRFLGNHIVGYAFQTEDAKQIAAWHYVRRYYGNERNRFYK